MVVTEDVVIVVSEWHPICPLQLLSSSVNYEAVGSCQQHVISRKTNIVDED